jgi:hypothetical protein
MHVLADNNLIKHHNKIRNQSSEDRTTIFPLLILTFIRKNDIGN